LDHKEDDVSEVHVNSENPNKASSSIIPKPATKQPINKPKRPGPKKRGAANTLPLPYIYLILRCLDHLRKECGLFFSSTSNIRKAKSGNTKSPSTTVKPQCQNPAIAGWDELINYIKLECANYNLDPNKIDPGFKGLLITNLVCYGWMVTMECGSFPSKHYLEEIRRSCSQWKIDPIKNQQVYSDQFTTIDYESRKNSKPPPSFGPEDPVPPKSHAVLKWKSWNGSLNPGEHKTFNMYSTIDLTDPVFVIQHEVNRLRMIETKKGKDPLIVSVEEVINKYNRSLREHANIPDLNNDKVLDVKKTRTFIEGCPLNIDLSRTNDLKEVGVRNVPSEVERQKLGEAIKRSILSGQNRNAPTEPPIKQVVIVDKKHYKKYYLLDKSKEGEHAKQFLDIFWLKRVPSAFVACIRNNSNKFGFCDSDEYTPYWIYYEKTGSQRSWEENIKRNVVQEVDYTKPCIPGILIENPPNIIFTPVLHNQSDEISPMDLGKPYGVISTSSYSSSPSSSSSSSRKKRQTIADSRKINSSGYIGYNLSTLMGLDQCKTIHPSNERLLEKFRKAGQNDNKNDDVSKWFSPDSSGVYPTLAQSFFGANLYQKIRSYWNNSCYVVYPNANTSPSTGVKIQYPMKIEQLASLLSLSGQSKLNKFIRVGFVETDRKRMADIYLAITRYIYEKTRFQTFLNTMINTEFMESDNSTVKFSVYAGNASTLEIENWDQISLYMKKKDGALKPIKKNKEGCIKYFNCFDKFTGSCNKLLSYFSKKMIKDKFQYLPSEDPNRPNSSEEDKMKHKISKHLLFNVSVYLMFCYHLSLNLDLSHEVHVNHWPVPCFDFHSLFLIRPYCFGSMRITTCIIDAMDANTIKALREVSKDLRIQINNIPMSYWINRVEKKGLSLSKISPTIERSFNQKGKQKLHDNNDLKSKREYDGMDEVSRKNDIERSSALAKGDKRMFLTQILHNMAKEEKKKENEAMDIRNVLQLSGKGVPGDRITPKYHSVLNDINPYVDMTSSFELDPIKINEIQLFACRERINICKEKMQRDFFISKELVRKGLPAHIVDHILELGGRYNEIEWGPSESGFTIPTCVRVSSTMFYNSITKKITESTPEKITEMIKEEIARFSQPMIEGYELINKVDDLPKHNKITEDVQPRITPFFGIRVNPELTNRIKHDICGQIVVYPDIKMSGKEVIYNEDNLIKKQPKTCLLCHLMTNLMVSNFMANLKNKEQSSRSINIQTYDLKSPSKVVESSLEILKSIFVEVETLLKLYNKDRKPWLVAIQKVIKEENDFANNTPIKRKRKASNIPPLEPIKPIKRIKTKEKFKKQ